MRRATLFVVVLAIVFAACGGSRGGPTTPAPSAVEVELMQPLAPPSMPHEYRADDITRRSNACLNCHTQTASLDSGLKIPAIPESHFVDPVTAARQSEVVGMRYVCTQCHVSRPRKETPQGVSSRGAH